tara:strand:- start:204 stop:476 length:273 start_codon:yes stop_codon:yes gene_type:complete
MKEVYPIILLSVLLLGGCASEIDDPVDIPTACSTAGGEWNECSSPCLGTGAEICAQVCVAQCECLEENGFSCPEGYTCRKIDGESKGACA